MVGRESRTRASLSCGTLRHTRMGAGAASQVMSQASGAVTATDTHQATGLCSTGRESRLSAPPPFLHAAYLPTLPYCLPCLRETPTFLNDAQPHTMAALEPPKQAPEDPGAHELEGIPSNTTTTRRMPY